MTRMKWERTQSARGGFDERTTREWRVGPTLSAADLSDGQEDRFFPDLSRSPPITWAKDLTRIFKKNNEVTHERMRKEAIRTAHRIYRYHGVNTLMSRTLKLYERASRSNPFPSAYFALHFDFAAREIAVGTRFQHDPKPTRRPDRFYSIGEMRNRAVLVSMRMIEEQGGFLNVWNRLRCGKGPFQFPQSRAKKS